MKPFFDLHTHILCGVDDGAATEEEMYAMLEAAYADGVRALCLTPHYSPYLFGDTYEASQAAFALLERYAAQKHPDVRLFLGHELGYYRGAAEALAEGLCRTVAGSRYVLVDFPERVDFFELSSAMNHLRSLGYTPILAHTERYRCLWGRLSWIRSFAQDGGVIQLNAGSAAGQWGGRCRRMWKKLVKAGLVHIISSDAHNLTTRPPCMSACQGLLERYCHPEVVECLTWRNAWCVVEDRAILSSWI